MLMKVKPDSCLSLFRQYHLSSLFQGHCSFYFYFFLFIYCNAKDIMQYTFKSPVSPASFLDLGTKAFQI